MNELQEAGETASEIRTELEAALVRGIGSSRASDLRALSLHAEHWQRLGASEVSGRLRAAISAATANSSNAAEHLLRTFTSLHVFERLLSAEIARQFWRANAYERPSTEPTPPTHTDTHQGSSSTPALDPEARNEAMALAKEIRELIESLARSGLASATDATRARLELALKTAARCKLGRLAATLRLVSDEVGRFLAEDGTFVARRYAFCLHRVWLLATSLSSAFERRNEPQAAFLIHGQGAPRWLDGPLDVVTLGIDKRVSTACAFDFRLRVLAAPTPSLVGASIVYSVVFPNRPGVQPEANLLLVLPQKFAPTIFRESNVVRLNEVGLIDDPRTGMRLVFSPKTTAIPVTRYTPRLDHYTLDPALVLERLQQAPVTPLDIAREHQDELLLRDWSLDRTSRGRPILSTSRLGEVDAVGSSTQVLHVSVPSEDEEAVLKKLATYATQAKRPALYGTVFYEFGHVWFIPLAALPPDAPAEFLLLFDKYLSLRSLFNKHHDP